MSTDTILRPPPISNDVRAFYRIGNLEKRLGALEGRFFERHFAKNDAESTVAVNGWQSTTQTVSIPVNVPENSMVGIFIDLYVKGSTNQMYPHVGVYEATDFPNSESMLEANATIYERFTSAPSGNPTSGIIGTGATHGRGGIFQYYPTPGLRTYTMRFNRNYASGTAYFLEKKLWILLF